MVHVALSLAGAPFSRTSRIVKTGVLNKVLRALGLI